MRLFSPRTKQTSLAPRRLSSPWRTFKPRLEQLEDRFAPATVTWIGPASGGDWDTNAYWTGGTRPGSGEDVVIPANISLTHSQSYADVINNLTTGSSDALSASSGSLTISAHSAIDPNFALSISSATVSFNAAVPETVTLASLTIAGGGNLTGTDNFVVSGQFNWLSGTLSGPTSSSLMANGGLLIGVPYNNSLDLLDGRTLTNNAAAVFTGNNPIGLVDGAALNNGSPTNSQATFLAQFTWPDASIDAFDAVGGVFNNYGAFQAQAPSLRVTEPFNNYGTVEIQSGTTNLGTPGQSSGQSTGSFTVDRGATLRFYGTQTFAPTVSVTGGYVDFEMNGPVTLTTSYSADATGVGGVVIFQGPASPGTLGVGGRADFSATGGPITITLASLTIAGGGNLTGTDNFVVSGQFNWLSGTLSGPTSSSLMANGGLLIGVPYNNSLDLLDGRTLTNNAAVTWAGSTVGISNGAAFTNAPTGTFNDQIDGTFGSSGSDCPIFTNQGLFLKSGGTGTTNLEMQLNNNGTVRIDQGILNLGCGYVQGSGGSISGSVSGSVSNPGTYNSAPSSNPPPLLTSYTQTVTGTLYEQIGGLTAGTQYGQLIVNGSVNLAGSLQVALINSFRPVFGNQFTIIDNKGTNPINGTFNNLPEGATFIAGGYQFHITYEGSYDSDGIANDVVLTVTKVALQVVTNSSLMLVGNNAPPLTGSLNGTPFTGSINYLTSYGDLITVTLTTAATSASPVGQYAITAILSGTNSGNYIIDPATSQLGTMYVVSVGADPSGTGAKSVTFWDNKGNATLISSAGLSSLDLLNLINQGGAAFDPKAVAQLQSWLSISPNATTSYQLAVQLAVMDLNVLSGYVKSTDLVYAGALLPYASTDSIVGLTSGGFISVQNLMNAANAILGLDPKALAGDPNQPYELALAQVLQAANLNTDFVQQELSWGLLALYATLT